MSSQATAPAAASAVYHQHRPVNARRPLTVTTLTGIPASTGTGARTRAAPLSLAIQATLYSKRALCNEVERALEEINELPFMAAGPAFAAAEEILEHTDDADCECLRAAIMVAFRASHYPAVAKRARKILRDAVPALQAREE